MAIVPVIFIIFFKQFFLKSTITIMLIESFEQYQVIFELFLIHFLRCCQIKIDFDSHA